jgi:uncharacterized protein YutE (UPF0331/DUF86 family)
MEKNRLALLKLDIQVQMEMITNTYRRLEQRAEKLEASNPVCLESIAYQIHNLYNAIEDLLKIVANHFENNLSSNPQWHSLLLQRMKQEISSVRPALISDRTFSLLNGLRGFRHFFRHAYGVDIEYEQLQINLDKSLRLLPLLTEDVNNFLDKFEGDGIQKTEI